MNYFAHGWRFVDRPWFLAGTAVPDWLSVADRQVRMRPPRVAPFADGSGTVRAEVAAGIMQHLDDDRWFHRTVAFFQTTGQLTRSFRDLLGPEDGYRPSFLGHIAVELLLDGILADREPARLDRYYDAIDSIDPREVERAVNDMAARPTARLAPLIPLFRREQFLRDYSDPARLLVRLNHVMRRITLRPLPVEAEAVLKAGRALVSQRADELLERPASL